MTIDFKNGFHLDLVTNESGEFAGIGRVAFGHEILRADTIPWTFYTESESADGACRFEKFRLKKVVQDGSECTITFTSEGTWLPRIQAADAMGDARIKVRRVSPAMATFQWSFKSITEKIQENDWPGLSMQLRMESAGWPIHWILEATTWEIGGDAAGSYLVQQDVSTIDLEQQVTRDSAFSTIEKFSTDSNDAWGGSYPMDMLPRAAGSAICDFQVKGDLALCLFAPKPGLTRSRIDKRADEQVIHYTERPFLPLTECALFPERRLLVYKHSAPLKRHEWRNLWLDCFTHTRDLICGNYGYTPEVPLPSIHSHLWDDDLNLLGTAWPQALKEAIPGFRDLGYKQVFTFGAWEGITSDPVPGVSGNICSPYNFRFAERFGGAQSMEGIVETAKANGIDIFQWFSFHLSSASSVWKEHPDWILREANGEPWDGSYGSIWSGRIRSGFGKWFKSQIMDVRRETGMQGIFWDSYQNLGVSCIDWSAPDKAPQAEEIWHMQAELQRQGYKQRSEVVTIFGVSQVALYGFEDDKFRRRLWSDAVRNDDVFALLDTSPAFFTSAYPFTRDKVSPELYFWLAAHRCIPSLGARPWGPLTQPNHVDPLLPGGDLAQDYARVNHLYTAALPSMTRLRLQEGGAWLLWQDDQGRPAIAWAFREVKIPFRGRMANLETSEEFETDGRAILQPGSVYRFNP